MCVDAVQTTCQSFPGPQRKRTDVFLGSLLSAKPLLWTPSAVSASSLTHHSCRCFIFSGLQDLESKGVGVQSYLWRN